MRVNGYWIECFCQYICSVIYLNFGGQITQQVFLSHVAILELFLLCVRLAKKKTK